MMSELNDTATIRRTPTPQAAGSALLWTLTRCLPSVAPDQTVCPTCLVHRSGYSGATRSRLSTSPLQTLDDPAPQMVEQLVEVFRLIDTRVPEQVIDVPKITSQDVIPPRAVLRVPQMAEQLVEVPTVPCLPQGMTILARFSDAAGHSWSQVAGPTTGVFWWRSGTLHVQWTPSQRGTPPGQGGIQILAAVGTPVVDVPVTLQ